MEILGELYKKKKSQGERLKFRKKLSVISYVISSGESVKELKRIRRRLLLKSNKNVSRFTISSRGSIPLSDEQVQTIVSMLPDEVINHASSYEIRKFECSVFFVDVSGFTDLSDKYQSVENGASKLSSVLNFYLGSMVQEILSHGGDILKYSGDAFIAIFRSENENMLQEAVRQAIDSALIIQTNCRNYETDVGVTLNVKISISGGEVAFSLIGNEKSSHYVIVGEPVWQAKALQDHIHAGEVLVTPIAWCYTDEQLYTYRYNRELRFYDVQGFKDNLGAMQRQQEATIDFYEMERKMGKDELSSASTTLMKQSLEHIAMESSFKREESYLLRSSMNKPLESRSKKLLRRFIIPPLMKLIDLNDSVEFLTEMRDVVIVFVNLVVPKSTSEQLVKIVDMIYNTLSKIVITHEGIVNKVSLFDKDMMFLVIFGLRGYKHELESRIALRCASEVHQTFKTWKEITTVSIGVTSGMSYCGVVGHSLRREYSVISVTVNKAARLMMAYPDIVSCDQETVLNSKLELKHFTLLPMKSHKGLRGQILAYDFKEIAESRSQMNVLSLNLPPLLGRSSVMSQARQLLLQAVENHNNVSQNLEPIFAKSSCLVVKGSSQEGKTRILEEIHLSCVRQGLRCFPMSMQVKDLNKPFRFVRKFFTKIFNMEVELFEEEIKKLIQTVDETLLNYLSVFNPIFEVNYPQTDVMKSASEDEVDVLTKSMFSVFCKKAIRDFWVLLVDDSEYMDKESFLLLDSIFTCDTTFTFLTLGTHRKLSLDQKKIIHEPYVTILPIEELDMMYQNALACQCLGVEALSIELEMYLHENSSGNPGWIQTCTQSLLQSEKLIIERMAENEARKKGFIIVRDMIEPDKGIFSQCCHRSETEENVEIEPIGVAILVEFPLKLEFLTNTKTDRDLLVYDSLSSYEQLVCKSASVLGVVFSRDMLSYIMSNSTDRMIAKAQMKLFELHVFACTSAIGNDCGFKRQKSSDIVACNCRDLKILQSCRDLPKYSCCSKPRFQREGFKKVVYESLTEKQRAVYHRRSLNYLHIETEKCAPCGGDKFPVLTHQELDHEFHDGYYDVEDDSHKRMVEYFKSIGIPIEVPSKKNFLTKLFSMKSTRIRPVALNYLNYDFSRCECNKILKSTFSDIIHHCYGHQNIVKLIDAKISLAYVCIQSSNIPYANNLLKQAMSQLKEGNFNKETRYSEYLEACCLTLKGMVLEEMSQNEKALECYYESCSTLDVSFPRKFNLKARLLTIKFSIEIKSLLQEKQIPKTSRLFLLISSQSSRTISRMFTIFNETGQHGLAKLAAFWSLRQALRFDRSCDDVARCFANVIQVINSPKVSDCNFWTSSSLEQVSRSIFLSGLDLEKLREVVRLYRELMILQ